jgi:hypothetical protein
MKTKQNKQWKGVVTEENPLASSAGYIVPPQHCKGKVSMSKSFRTGRLEQELQMV